MFNNNKKKIIILATAGLLLLGGISTLGIYLHKKIDTTYVDEFGGLNISNSTNILLKKIDENTYSLKATITPSDATYKTVKWSIYWNDPSSDFARNKDVSEFVEIKSTTTDTLAITLVCKKAFGEKIIVKAVALDNEEAFGLCSLEYEKKIEALSVSVNGKTEDNILIKNNEKVLVSHDVTYSDVFTKYYDYKYEYSFVDLQNYTVDIQSKRGEYNLSAANKYFKELVNSSTSYSKESLRSWLLSNVKDYGWVQYSYLNIYGDMEWDKKSDVTIDEYISMLGKQTMTFKVSTKNKEDTIKCKFDTSVAVQSLELDETTIVF